MIDLSKTLDMGTNFPNTWKTLVRELLLKFEDGCTYTHHNIAGNRPYHVSLEIKIDDPVDDETYNRLHEKSKAREDHINNITEALNNLFTLDETQLEQNIECLKEEILTIIQEEKERDVES